jgi:hypothetical protein
VKSIPEDKEEELVEELLVQASILAELKGKNKMKKLTTIALGALMSLNFACMVDRPYDDASSEDIQYELLHISFSNSTDEEVDVGGGSLMGDIGEIKNIDNPATIGGFHDEEYTSLEVIMHNRKGAAMVMLSIFGGVNHEDLVPGSVHQFIPNTANRDGLSVEALVCSGDGAPGDWSYDDISNLVRVDVENTEFPGQRRLNFTTYTEDDVATGHVDIIAE